MDVASIITAGMTAATGFIGAALGVWSQSHMAKAQWEHERQQREEDRIAAENAEAKARERHAAFAALDIANLLERYALSCAEVISDNDGVDPMVDAQQHMNVPNLPAFSPDLDWRVFEPGETSQVWAFRVEVDLTILNQSARLNDSDPYTALGGANFAAARIGERAWALAARLRDQHGLPAVQTSHLAWDYRDTLRNVLARHHQEPQDPVVSVDGVSP